MPTRRKIIIISIAVILLALIYGLASFLRIERAQVPIIYAKMILTSPAFENNGEIPSKYSCDGGNHNPALNIQYVPENAKSLALIVHDPDAPVTGGFTHWVVWNIDPETSIIKEESVPSGSVEGNNDSGELGYTGPCPPRGAHHYYFKLYALDAILDLPEGSGRISLENEIKKYLLAETELVGIYERKK